MNQNKNNMCGFDFIRAFSVFFVFMAHIINKQCENTTILLIERAISPGMTMSLLGFISGYLLSSKYKTKFDGIFFIKRFSRIYSSLFICLTVIVVIHIILSYDVINIHSIIHYMGLSLFIDLLQVNNISSIGNGLWFITIINIMYLTLPLMTYIYSHKNKVIHLLSIIIICIFLNHVIYTVPSAWNVIIAFNIGCFIGVSSSIDKSFQKPTTFYAIATLLLFILSALATSSIIQNSIRGLLFPLYPFFIVPLLFRIGSNLRDFMGSTTIWFSSISYEVYIIHFYFINRYFEDFFPNITSIFLQIVIALIIVLPLAHILSKISSAMSKTINNYLIHQQNANSKNIQIGQ